MINTCINCCWISYFRQYTNVTDIHATEFQNKNTRFGCTNEQAYIMTRWNVPIASCLSCCLLWRMIGLRVCLNFHLFFHFCIHPTEALNIYDKADCVSLIVLCCVVVELCEALMLLVWCRCREKQWNVFVQAWMCEVRIRNQATERIVICHADHVK